MCVSRTSVSSILVSLAGLHEHMRFTQLREVTEYKWTVQTTSGVSNLTLEHAEYSPCSSGLNVAVAPDCVHLFNYSMFDFYFVSYLASLIGCCIA